MTPAPRPAAAPTAAAYGPVSEQQLVARARDGDPHAFEQLLRRHQREMYVVALRILLDPDDAEDATQSAFIAAWRRLPQFRGHAAFSTWLYRIVTNHALNLLRRRARVQASVQSVDDLTALAGARTPVTSETDPYRSAETRALLTDLRAALAALPDELRVCWLLREVDNCSYQEVATLTGTSLDTVRGRIYRARHRLAEAMTPWR